MIDGSQAYNDLPVDRICGTCATFSSTVDGGDLHLIGIAVGPDSPPTGANLSTMSRNSTGCVELLDVFVERRFVVAGGGEERGCADL